MDIFSEDGELSFLPGMGQDDDIPEGLGRASSGRGKCQGCARAASACLCDAFPEKKLCPSLSRVVILRHPEEAGEAMATVPLITDTIENVLVIDARRFSAENLPLSVARAAEEAEMKSSLWKRTLLLWPSESSEPLDKLADELIEWKSRGGTQLQLPGAEDGGCTLVLLDGTWMSCAHIYDKSPMLHALRCVRVTPTEDSRYTIRHASVQSYCRSTLEALGDALLILEGSNTYREALFKPLVKMVGIQQRHIKANGGPTVRDKKQRKQQGGREQVAEKGGRRGGDQLPGQRAGEAMPVDETAEFSRVRRNKVALLGFLVGMAQRIEKGWEDEGGRKHLLEMYRSFLLDLQEDHDDDLKELGRLGPKMKTLDFGIDHFLKMSLPVERKHTRGLKDHEFLVETDDRVHTLVSAAEKMPLTVVLDNLRSAFNVGSVFRTSECMGVEHIVLCGYTATPDDQQTQRSAMGTDKVVPWEWQRSTLEAIKGLKQKGLTVVALETVKGSPYTHQYSFPRTGCALILGNERHGLESDVLSQCDVIVQIPCTGVKNSLNVASAYGMCVYEIMRQWRGSDTS